MLRAVIIEDEPHAVRRLTSVLKTFPDVAVVGAARDGEAGLAMIRRMSPDIVFLDISLPRLTGIQVAAALDPAAKGAPVVIFVTAYDRFALDAFELAAADYLLKPIELDRVAAALDRARVRVAAGKAGERVQELEGLLAAFGTRAAQRTRYETEMWVSGRRGTTRLMVDTVRWLEAERDYVRIHAEGGEHLVREPLHSLIDRLDPEVFVRVHRSAAVNLAQVAKVERRVNGALRIVLAAGDKIAVGRSYAPLVRALISERNPNGPHASADSDSGLEP